MECAWIPVKEHSRILNMTGGVNIDKLKKVMAESFTEKILRDIDERCEEPDQVAYADDDGWFHANEETINAVDNLLAWER